MSTTTTSVAADIANGVAAILSRFTPATPPTAPAEAGPTVEVPRDLLVSVLAARAAEAQAKAAKEKAEKLLKEYLGEATEATLDGTVVATFAPQERTSIDVKALQAELPELAARFERTTTVRSLLFKSKLVPSILG